MLGDVGDDSEEDSSSAIPDRDGRNLRRLKFREQLRIVDRVSFGDESESRESTVVDPWNGKKRRIIQSASERRKKGEKTSQNRHIKPLPLKQQTMAAKIQKSNSFINRIPVIPSPSSPPATEGTTLTRLVTFVKIPSSSSPSFDLKLLEGLSSMIVPSRRVLTLGV